MFVPTSCSCFYLFLFFNDTATTEIYTLSLHDALPIFLHAFAPTRTRPQQPSASPVPSQISRSEEHTSELQSRQYIVCRLLLEKKKKEHRRDLPDFRHVAMYDTTRTCIGERRLAHACYM